eukprot:gene3557-4432_t
MKSRKKNLHLNVKNQSLNDYSKQIEYLRLLQKNHLVSLKYHCFIYISKLCCDSLHNSNSNSNSNNNTPPLLSPTSSSTTNLSNSTNNDSNYNLQTLFNSSNGNLSSISPLPPTTGLTSSTESTSTLSTSNSNLQSLINLPTIQSSPTIIPTLQQQKLNLSQLPLELKEELIHFMLEHRLFHTSKLYQSLDFLSIVDSKIKSMDFSIIKSKISMNDPTKELMKICTNLQNVDFSYCYEANDSILKILISNLQSTSSSNHHGGNHSPISPPSSLPTTPIMSSIPNQMDDLIEASNNNNNNNNSNSPTLEHKKSKPFVALKNRILGKRKQENPITPTSPTTIPIFFNNNNNQQQQDLVPEDTLTTISDISNSTSSLTFASIQSDFDTILPQKGLLFLSLRQCSSFTDSTLRRLFKISPNLTYLDITGCKINSKTLLTITDTCLKLKTLSLNTIPLQLTPSHASTISNLSNLTSLDLSYLSKLTDSLLDSILSYPTTDNNNNKSDQKNNLPKSPSTTTSLSNSTTVVQPITGLTNSTSTTSMTSITSPRKLHISPSIQSLSSISSSTSSYCSLQSTPRLTASQDQTTTTTTTTTTLPQSYPNTILSLYLCQSDIEDESLGLISKRCPNLQELDVSYCTNISDLGFQDMANNGITSLISLSAKVVKVSSGLVDLVKSNPLISKLDVRFTKLEDAQLKEIAFNLSNLRILRLDGTPITDQVLKDICRNNLGIEVIGLNQCKNLTFEIFNILSSNCQSLKKLYMSHCRLPGGINLESSNRFFNQCKQLKLLDIAFTPMVCDDVIQSLTESNCAGQLEYLFIGGGFHHLSSESIQLIVDHCPRIKVFSCLSCYKVRDEPVLDGLKKWLLLEALELTDCTSVTANTVNFISTESHIHFHLRYIFFSSGIDVNEQTVMSKIDGKTSIELFEMRQEVSLEDIIEQNWISLN